MNKLLGPAYLLAFATLLLALAAGPAVGLVQAYRSKSWPLVEGRIESSSVVQGCGQHRMQYAAVVVYWYDLADGVRHRGDRLVSGIAPCDSEAVARATVERFPAGSAVKVAVNPNDMFDAVLLPGGASRGTTFLVLVMAAMAALLVVLGVRGLRRA